MSTFSIVGALDNLSPAALTVRAQTISPNDQGNLLWDIFFPRQNVDSVDLSDVTTLDDRAVSDRREWNGRGRYIPPVTPATRKVSIVPVESYDKIEEYEMQRLNEQTLGNETIIANIIGTRIPDRIDRLVLANYRRIEMDAIQAWTKGNVIQRNPQKGDTYTASFGFSASRLTTAGTAWSDVGVNAYDQFLAWYTASTELVGPGEGVMMRLATFNAIQADTLNAMGNAAPRLTRGDIEARIQDETGGPFRFYINENSLDVFDDGGTAKTRTKVWPTGYVAYIPSGKVVGKTAFAPVVRAMQLSAANSTADIDVRGMTAFIGEAGEGRELTMECQVNPLTVPDEQKVAVINAGI